MRNKLALMAALLALAGCGSVPGPTIDTACAWVRPILIGKADSLTRPTAGAVLAHNLKWQRNCPGGK